MIDDFIRVWWDHPPTAPLHSPARAVKIDIVEGPWALDRDTVDALIAKLITARAQTWPFPEDADDG